MNSSQRVSLDFTKLLLSALICFFLAACGYLIFLQSPMLYKRDFLSLPLIWLLLTPLVYLLLSRFLLPHLREYTPRAQRNWLLLSFSVGLLFSIVTRPPQLILFLPIHTLQLLIPSGLTDRNVTLEWASTAIGGDISFSQFSTSGNWQRIDSGFSFSGSEPASLSWSGRTGDSATLLFSASPALAEVQAGWEGNLSGIDTSQTYNGQVPLSFSFPTPWLSSVAARLLVGFAAGFLFLILTIFLASLELKPAKPVKHKKGYWLLYTIPMIAIWGIWLLVLFPGIMTSDSINQWKQIVSGQFNDANPVFHTFTMWLITRIWFSPAAVVIFQILALSLTVAWGVSILDEQGLPRWAAWGISSLFALSPVNDDLIITLWKDILYSTVILLFSLIILKIIFSHGAWLSKKTIWLWLILSSLSISLYRHNGLPVPVFTLISLSIVYRQYWKRFFYSVLFLLFAFSIFEIMAFPILNIDRALGFNQYFFIHHIAAHIENGMPLSKQEKATINKILPMNQWEYNCCSILTITSAKDFSNRILEKNRSSIRELSIRLAVKEPFVEIQHLACISSIVWELPSRCKNDTQISLENRDQWIASNQIGLNEDSKLPFFVSFFRKWIFWAYQPPLGVLTYTASIFLYLGFFCTIFISFRKNDLHFVLFIVPSLVQSTVISIVNIGANFRYQYGVYLIGLFSLGLLVLALISSKNNRCGLDRKM